MTRGQPGIPPVEPADPRLAGLLRWYPRTWRERYGEEFLILVEDTLDGRKPGWRLRLSVTWSGLREWGRVLAGPAGRRAASRWPTFILAGSLLAGSVEDILAYPPAARAWEAVTAMTVLATLAAVTGAAIVAAGLAARPSLVRFLRSGGWPKIRRRSGPWRSTWSSPPGSGRPRRCWPRSSRPAS
jgi:hypothetical protein